MLFFKDELECICKMKLISKGTPLKTGREVKTPIKLF
jgi:hypothetical protein